MSVFAQPRSTPDITRSPLRVGRLSIRVCRSHVVVVKDQRGVGVPSGCTAAAWGLGSSTVIAAGTGSKTLKVLEGVCKEMRLSLYITSIVIIVVLGALEWLSLW